MLESLSTMPAAAHLVQVRAHEQQPLHSLAQADEGGPDDVQQGIEAV